MGDISEVRNGIDYEHFVANQFKESGWTAQVTKASVDQGADVKIWSGDVDAVVQCKWYQNAVGNKAVQEIVAARTHYGVHNAIVVSKSGYTDAARELANTNDVWLIHHDEIPDLYRAAFGVVSRCSSWSVGIVHASIPLTGRHPNGRQGGHLRS
jgi:restriction system protein